MVIPPRRNGKGKFKSKKFLSLEDKSVMWKRHAHMCMYVRINRCTGRHM